MDNTPIPPASAAPSKPDTTMTDSPQKYVPQFSAATEMILKRINSGASATGLSSIGGGASYMGGTAKYEDMRRTVLKAMKTSMNMELPNISASGSARSKAASRNAGSAGRAKASSTTPGATPSASGSASGGKKKGKGRGRPKAGTKRKRGHDDEDETESTEESDEMSQLGGDSDEDQLDDEEVSVLPKITQSGRQINKPAQFVPASYETPSKKRAAQPKRNQDQALCKRCARGHSPVNNMIVFCDGCNLCWHQLCHDPVISEETVKDEAAPWFCADCTRKRGVKTAGHEQVRGVSWQGRSENDKRNYFQSLPHNHLVSLLMQATILHPNIPIFPGEQVRQSAPPPAKASSSRANPQVLQPFPPSALASAGLFPRTDSNPRASMNFIRKIPPGSTPPLPNSSASVAAQSAPPSLPSSNQNQNPPANQESRESTPASPPYPKPGNGLMAKLGPDDEDLEWLVDENDFDAFSHTVYDEQGNPQVLQADNDLGMGMNGGGAHAHG